MTQSSGSENKLPLRERNKVRNYQDLIDAATMLIEKKGYEETTIQDIVNEVGMSYSSFFRYFKSKEELVLSIEQTGWDSYATIVDQILNTTDDPFRATLEGEINSFASFDKDEVRAERVLKNQKLIFENPSLYAAYLLKDIQRTEELGHFISNRIGSHYETDTQLRCWIARVEMVGRLTFRILVESYLRGEEIRSLDLFMDLLEESHLIEDCKKLSKEYVQSKESC